MADVPQRADLVKLPLRALVAYAVRCARRVKPSGPPADAEFLAALEEALAAAESFAAGTGAPAGERLEQLADRVVEVTEPLGDEPDSRYSAGYAAAYAAKAASTGVFAAAPPDLPDLGGAPHAAEIMKLVEGMTGAAAADATAKHAESAGEASNAAADTEATGTTSWSDDPKAVKARKSNAALAWADFKKLASLNLGKFPEQGLPVDPGPAGPLGPL